jgi:CheY-like chemotaxis protein
MTEASTPRGLSRVLFVPDDLLTGELRESFLDRESFLVRTASDADTALAMAEVWRPSLVVFRSDLEGVRISDFCARLRNARSAPPKLVMLTEQVGDALNDAVDASSDCHLISPVDNAQLLATIATLLEVAQRQRPRATLETLVHADGFASVQDGDGPTMGNSLDVSEDGMLIECNRQLPIDAEGSLHFFIPGASQRLLLRGVVRMAVDEIRQHYVIEWRDMAAGERALIRRYVERTSA